jgi:NAD(P)-dependent dehydrogenase (short-subunit alcohol dehydrogenase family)
MKGKVTVVTGANGGLGNHVTQALLDAGATVVGVSRKIQPSEFNSPQFTALRAELSTTSGAKGIVDQVLGRFKKIDVLAHLVGGFDGGKSVADTDFAILQRMLDLNLTALFYMIQAVVPAMRQSGYGRIIAIGSRTAVEPAPGVGVYSASKAAMVSLIRTVALENGDAGITANVILPGMIDTPANRASDPKADFSKWVSPASIASQIIWLAGDAGKDVNGAAIPIYGSTA